MRSNGRKEEINGNIEATAFLRETSLRRLTNFKDVFRIINQRTIIEKTPDSEIRQKLRIHN